MKLRKNAVVTMLSILNDNNSYPEINFVEFNTDGKAYVTNGHILYGTPIIGDVPKSKMYLSLDLLKLSIKGLKKGHNLTEDLTPLTVINVQYPKLVELAETYKAKEKVTIDLDSRSCFTLSEEESNLPFFAFTFTGTQLITTCGINAERWLTPVSYNFLSPSISYCVVLRIEYFQVKTASLMMRLNLLGDKATDPVLFEYQDGDSLFIMPVALMDKTKVLLKTLKG